MRDHKVLIQNMTLSKFSDEHERDFNGDEPTFCWQCNELIKDEQIILTIGIGDYPKIIEVTCFSSIIRMNEEFGDFDNLLDNLKQTEFSGFWK